MRNWLLGCKKTCASSWSHRQRNQWIQQRRNSFYPWCANQSLHWCQTMTTRSQSHGRRKVIGGTTKSPSSESNPKNGTPSSSAFKRGWSYCWVCQGNKPHKSSAPRSWKNPGSPRGRKKAIYTGGNSDVARVDWHQWYLKACAEGYIMLAARIKHTHFYRGMDDIWIDFDHFWFYSIKTP